MPLTIAESESLSKKHFPSRKPITSHSFAKQPSTRLASTFKLASSECFRPLAITKAKRSCEFLIAESSDSNCVFFWLNDIRLSWHLFDTQANQQCQGTGITHSSTNKCTLNNSSSSNHVRRMRHPPRAANSRNVRKQYLYECSVVMCSPSTNLISCPPIDTL